MSSIFHLVKRFVSSLRPGPIPTEDDRWARLQLIVGEQEIWARMNNPDRRHAVGVARAVKKSLGGDASRPVLAAALLHDSGKVVSNLRTPARVVASVAMLVFGRSRVATLQHSRWPFRNLGQYSLHPELGAALLAEAGSDRLTIDWAAQHHKPEERWTIPASIGRVLKDCDDD